MKRAVWENRQAMYDAYRTRPAFKDWQEEAFWAFIEGGTRLLDDGRAQLKCLPEVEAIFYEIRDSLDVTQYLHGLQGQYLLLLGDYSGCQTLEDAGVRRFLELVEKSRVKPMGKGSHFLPMEYPELVLQEIKAFFNSPPHTLNSVSSPIGEDDLAK
jgi:pimeloyl-ACP methyl ester carboxylesterase